MALSDCSLLGPVVKEGRLVKRMEVGSFDELDPVDRPRCGALSQGTLLIYPVYSPKKEIMGALRVYSNELSQKDVYVAESVSLLVGEYLGELERHQAQASLT